MKRKTHRSTLRMASALTAACLASLLALHTDAAELRFDQPAYVVTPGQTFQVDLYLDMNALAPGAQPPGAGLLSAGTRVSINPVVDLVTSASAIIVPSPLDYGAFGGTAEREFGPGYAGALGLVEALAPYYDPLVLTLAIALDTPGVYEITPALFYSDTRANVLDGAFNVLDDQITNFVSSSITVQSLSAAPRIIGIAPSGEDILITFMHTNAPPGGWYEVDGASNAPPLPWMPEPDADITTNAPGLYTARVAMSNFVARFYRIRGLW